MRVCARERQTDRERETDRQTDREREREREGGGGGGGGRDSRLLYHVKLLDYGSERSTKIIDNTLGSFP